MFPVCAGIETSTVPWFPPSLPCFPCVRELKREHGHPELKTGLFPVCAGIEISITLALSVSMDVSRVREFKSEVQGC